MKETITLRNLMEAIDQITESNRLQVKDIEAFATYMSDGDEEEKEYRTLKMHQGNEFYDMKQKGFKEGNIYVDFNGDEFEAPVTFFEPYTGDSQEFDSEGHRGLMGGGMR